MSEFVSEHEFQSRGKSLRKGYKAAKSNLIKVRNLGPELIRPINNEMARVTNIECRAGCAHCCNLRVVAFPFEVVAIYMHLVRQLSETELSDTKLRVNEQFDLIRNLSPDEHFTTNVECPLLQNERCSVYKVRPLSCAGYHSTSEAACKESNDNPDITGTDAGGIPMIASVRDILAAQHGVATQVLKLENDDSEQYELIRALKQIFDDPTLVQKWEAGRSIFEDTS